MLTLDEQIMQKIANLRGKYIKQTLSRIEEEKQLSKVIRKAVLDGFNDLYRELYQHLGYEHE